MINPHLYPTAGNSTTLFSNEDNFLIVTLYICFSSISLISNALVCYIILRSKLMRLSPKYWMVLAVSVVLLLQAAFANSVITSVWITRSVPETGHCWLWVVVTIYCNYVGPAVISHTTLLMLIDFLFCLVSSNYVNKYRSKVVIGLMTSSYVLIMVTILPTFMALAGKHPHPATDENEAEKRTDSPCSFHVHQSSYRHALVWFALFGPIALSIVCCMAVIVCRYSRAVQKYMGLDFEIVSESLRLNLDNVIFLAFEIFLFCPGGVAYYNDVTCQHGDDCPVMSTLLLSSTLLADNAGVLLPVSWFVFKDMHNTVKHLFMKLPTMPRSRTSRAFSSTPEVQLVDMYPYCFQTSE